ncbi:MAG TPA: CHAT domain-containing protein [Candidatus Angelobacter sp.]|nr:CHAT domain-containing protein [Candidatus Angelobacter sp.]
MTLLSGCASRQPDFGALYTQAKHDFERGDLAAASREAEDGFQRSETKDPIWNYKFRVLLANVYLWQGGLRPRALQLLDTPPPPELATGEFAARRKALQGSLLTSPDRIVPEAHVRLAEAEALALSGAPSVESEVLLDQGTLAIDEHDLEAGNRFLLRGLSLARANHQPWIETQITGSLGWMEGQREHYGVAIDWLRKSLEVAQSIGARQLQATTQLNLAWLNSEIGDFEAAIPALKEAENLAENPSLKEIIQNNLGEIYRNQGKYEQAWDAFSKARELGASNPGYEEGLIDSLSGLAGVALAQGRISTAEPLEQEAQKVLSQSKNPNPRLAEILQLLHADLLRASGHLDEAKGVLFALLKQQILSSNRWQADFELASIYVDTHQNGLAQRQFEKVLRTLNTARESLSDMGQQLAFSTRESSFYKSYVEFLVSTGKQFDAFRIADRIRARTLREQPNKPSPEQSAPLSLAALQSSLGLRKQILLSYWLAPRRSFVWLVTASRFQMFELPSSGSLEPEIKTYLDEMVKGKGIQDAAGQDGEELYKILITPVEKFIPANADVVIVPDGMFATLNFETLVVPGASAHYWIKDVTVSNAVSVSALTRQIRSRHTPEDLLAIGDPVDKSGSPVLAHAKEEIKLVSSYAPAANEVVITGKDAPPSAYATSHPEKFRRIHFAAHGLSNQIRPLESAILLSPDGENSTSLYGYDIVKHKLNAELVVISSCKGAEGRIYGEGSVGLAWAFMKAGAHQVIAALWNLDDAAAAELMKTFYDGLSAGKSPAAALRAAKLSLMKDSNHQRPYYWATLQVYLGS